MTHDKAKQSLLNQDGSAQQTVNLDILDNKQAFHQKENRRQGQKKTD